MVLLVACITPSDIQDSADGVQADDAWRTATNSTLRLGADAAVGIFPVCSGNSDSDQYRPTHKVTPLSTLVLRRDTIAGGKKKIYGSLSLTGGQNSKSSTFSAAAASTMEGDADAAEEIPATPKELATPSTGPRTAGLNQTTRIGRPRGLSSKESWHASIDTQVNPAQRQSNRQPKQGPQRTL